MHQSTINLNAGLLVASASDPSGSTFLPAFAGLTVNVTNTVPARINTAGFTDTIAATLTNGTGNPDGGLVKLGTGTLYLLGNNAYNGLTTVSNGTLYISVALQSGTESFMVNDGKGFGAINTPFSSLSALIANLTLGNSSGATTVTFTNVADTFTPVIGASGAVTLNGNSTIRIADSVNLVAASEYPLIRYGTIATNSGSGFSLVLPPGVVGRLTNDTTIPAIALVVTSISVVPPSFTSIATSGSDLVLNGTGGTPFGTWTLLNSTNLTLPLVQWTTNTTGTFDGSGNFNYTVTGALGSGPRQFYSIQTP